jgi:hypothetical protein
MRAIEVDDKKISIQDIEIGGLCVFNDEHYAKEYPSLLLMKTVNDFDKDSDVTVVAKFVESEKTVIGDRFCLDNSTEVTPYELVEPLKVRKKL